jgi:DNA repair protein RecO (recombination protein O)
MAAKQRVVEEAAFVLHRYDWSESSLILDVFTRGMGRIALVAKGAKRPTSNFRPILLPLQPLRVVFGGEGDIRNLKGAEWVGGHVMPTGEALLSGLYLNELLLRLLARDDPHTTLFDAYGDAVQLLALGLPELLEPGLRAFELLLLREVGLLPVLGQQTMTLQPLELEARYSLVAEGGLRQSHADDRASLSGAQWLQLQRSLETHEARHSATGSPFAATLRACAEVGAGLKPQLRNLLHYHCGVATLHTRRMMMDLQNI